MQCQKTWLARAFVGACFGPLVGCSAFTGSGPAAEIKARPGRLSGVVNSAGGPVPRESPIVAQISARRSGINPVSTLSDARGRFLMVLSPGTYDIIAQRSVGSAPCAPERATVQPDQTTSIRIRCFVP